MLKELFEKDFFITFPHKPSLTPNVRESVMNADFTLSDHHACDNDCPQYKGCNYAVLRISNPLQKPVNVVDLNDVLGILADPFHDNADYVLCTNEDFIVAELTCISNDYFKSNDGTTYPQGKRAKARAQLETAYLAFYACPPVKQFVVRHTPRAILAYRANDMQSNTQSATHMESFVRMQYAVDNSMPRFPLTTGVEMEMVAYPQEYQV